MSDRHRGRVAVVTGAAGGIGFATVGRLAREGARVLAVDSDAAALAEACEGWPAGVETETADVTSQAQVEAYYQRAVTDLGGVDYVFNNAGIEGVVTPFEDYPLDVFERVLSVNVTGVFLGIKHAVGHLRARGGGAIVNTASTAGLQGSALLGAYIASKHAVIGLTRSAAAAYGREGIRVNAVCPAPIETRMMRSIETGGGGNDPGSVKDGFLARIPAGRYGEPEEVAALVSFLFDDEAAFIQSAMYTIDGGMTPF